MVSWIGFTQTPIAYQRQPRYSGETKYPFSKMMRFAFDAITGFSIRPLRIASYFGIVSAVSAVLLLLYSLSRWISGSTITGWTSLISVVLLLGAVQLLVLGIIGEYLGRLYMEAKRRPLYIIRDLLHSRRSSRPVSPDKALPFPVSTLANTN
jgi:dolichol-phosphate mannosyltransferase